MAGEIVAEGRVVLHVEENVRAELAKAEAAFDRTMAKLDGQQAELEIKLDSKDFEADRKKVEAEIKELEGKKATVTIDADSKKLDAAITKQEAQLKKLKFAETKLLDIAAARKKAEADYYVAMQKGEAKLASARAKAAEDRTKAEAKARAEIEKTRAANAKAEEDARKEATKSSNTRIAAEEKTRDAVRKSAAQKAKDDESARKQATKDANAVLAAQEKIREAVRKAAEDKRKIDERNASNELATREKIMGQSSRLERQYIELRKRRDKLERASSRVFMPTNEREMIKIDIRGVDEQIAEVRAKLALIGHPPPEVDIHLNTDDKGAASLSRWISAITTTTVRLGPFTTTIAGAGRALAIFGPIITGIVGSLGALVGAVGSAALGFGGALTAGVGAFGLVLGSTGLLLKPLMKDFKNLNTLQDAYHKQVLKTGAGSEKAKDKLKEFEHAMGEVPETTKAAFLGIDDLGNSFNKLSDKARPAFLNTFAEGLTTARVGLKRFGPEMVQSFNLVAGGVKSLFKSLRGPEATGIIGTLFDNGQKALPAFGRGLGNLAAAAGRVAAAFSKMLAPLGAGFEKWTDRFTDFTKDSSKLNTFVDKTVKSMQSLGHLLQSTGGFLAAFFGAGVGPGVELMDRMAGGIDRITNSIRSNPKGLGDFFGDSVDTAERLYGVLKPLATLFVEWATLMRPFTNIILSVAAGLGDLAASLAGFGPTRGLLMAAFSVFLAGTLVSKIRNVTQAIGMLAASLGTLGGKQAALRAGTALTGGALANLGTNARNSARGVGAATALTGAAAARGAGRTAANSGYSGAMVVPAGAARGVEKVAVAATRGAKAANALKVGLTGIGAVLGVANPAFGAAALAVTGAAAAYLYFKHRNDDVKQAVKDTAAATQRTADAYRNNSGALADTASQAERANLVVRQARRDLNNAKKGTDDWKLANLNLKDALRARGQSETAVQGNVKESIRLGKEQVTRTQDELKAFENLNGKRIKSNKAYVDDEMKRYGQLSINGKAKQKELNDLLAKQTQLQDRATAALNRNAAVSSNNARGLAGLTAAAGKAEQQLGQFARTADQASAKKIAVKFQDSGDAGRVAAAAGKAIRAGVPTKIATRVAVSTSDADVAVRRLNATKLTPKKLSIVMDGGKEAIHTVQQLTGLKLTDKQQDIITKGGPQAVAELGKLLGIKLPGKTQTITEKGAARVASALESLKGIKIPNKTMSAILRDLASGKISSIIGLINSIPASSTSTITTVHREVYETVRGRPISAANRAGGASGGLFGAAAQGANNSNRIAGGAYSSPVLNRTINRALKNAMGAGRLAKSAGQIVRQPSMVVGEQSGHPEYVIATNPAFRKRNKELVASAAQRFGMNVTAAAKGKKPKNPAATPKQLAGARAQARKHTPKNTNYSSDNLEELPKVEQAKQAEEDQARNISIEESKLKEPDTFLKVVATDPKTGDPVYAVDQPAVAAWSSKLAQMGQMYVDLIVKIQAVGTAVNKALTAVGKVITRSTGNIATIDSLKKREQKTLDSNKTSNAAKGAARERMKIYNEDRAAELSSLNNAKTDKKSLDDDAHDVPFRVAEAGVRRDEYNADSAAVQGKASADLAASIPRPEIPTPVDPNALAIAQAEAGLAEAALTVDTADDTAAQNAMLKANQGLIDKGRAMLADADPTNDIEAYGYISQGAGGVKSAQDALGALAGAGLSGILAQSEARSSLYSTMANNAALFSGNPGGAGSGAFQGAGGQASTGGLTGGKPVNIIQNFPTQPDPMTWAKSTLFELNSSL